MMRWVVLLASILSITACSSVDRGQCLESHTQVVMVPTLIGKTTIMSPRMQTVCDLWEYPEGRLP